jgi:hypothetical protein
VLQILSEHQNYCFTLKAHFEVFIHIVVKEHIIYKEGITKYSAIVLTQHILFCMKCAMWNLRVLGYDDNP